MSLKDKLEKDYDLKIFTDNIEQDALEQLYTLMKQDVFKDCKVRIQPDTHSRSRMCYWIYCRFKR